MSETNPAAAGPRTLDLSCQWIPAATALLAAAACIAFRPDDLYIYLRMSENVLSGAGWGFNPGEAVNVASSPAWLFVLLALGLAGGAAGAAQIASAAAFAVGIAGIARLAGVLASDRRAAWAAGLALAGDAWVGRWLWSGMETGLALAVVAWALALRAEATPGTRGDRIAGLLAAAAPLVRPELVLFSLAALIVELPALRRGRVGRLAWDASVLAALGALWGVFALLTWGSVLPSTAIAKGTLGAANIGALRAGARVVAVVGSTQGLAALLALAAAWSWWREPEGIVERAPGRRGVTRWIIVFGAAMVATYALRHVNVYTRYVLPLSGCLAALGLAWVVSVSAGSADRRRRLVWGIALALILAQNLVLASLIVVPKTRAYARSMRQVVLPLAHELRASTAPSDVIATPNIGAIGLISGRRILDLNGLATPEVVPYKREGRLIEYLELHRPEIVVEIEPRPRSFVTRSDLLDVEEIGLYRFDGMFVRGPDPMYLTVYRVRDAAGAAP